MYWNNRVSHYFVIVLVTPFVGVWIETLFRSVVYVARRVTPFVGVWIETLQRSQENVNKSSHPSWVCGLKQGQAALMQGRAGHTLRGCVDWNPRYRRSNHWSNGHTLRGCVDWNRLKKNALRYLRVTPFVGVWIETLTTILEISINLWMSHPSWVCGLKLFGGHWQRPNNPSHPSWVCGLKHHRA